jgi:hypothetical protein
LIGKPVRVSNSATDPLRRIEDRIGNIEWQLSVTADQCDEMLSKLAALMSRCDR